MGIGEMYVETEDSILSQLKNTYNLSDLEYKILTAYLKLDTSQRKAVEKFIADILKSEPQTIKVAARGNNSKVINIKKSDVEEDMKNYVPPEDL